MSSYGNHPQQPDYSQQSAYQQQPQYGQQPAYGQPYGYAGGPAPNRPGGVTAAAVIGFILGAFAVIGAILLFAGGSFLVGADDGGTGLANSLLGILVFFGLLILAVAVIMIWGSVLALAGRSRVLLIVGASLLTAFGLIGFFGSLGNEGTDVGGVIFQLIGLVLSIMIIVFLSLAPAAQYFAAHRAGRGR